MIMAAPLPSGVLQNEQIFLPLTDLDYTKHDLRAKQQTCTQLMAYVGSKHILKTMKIWETHGDGCMESFRSVVLKWFCFTSQIGHQVVPNTLSILFIIQNVIKNFLRCNHKNSC